MASALEPGMWCECAVDPAWPDSIGAGFKQRGIYRVERLLRPTYCPNCATECDGLEFVGVRSSRSGFGWPSCCFRPIGRDSPDLIESLKQPAPEFV